MLEIKGVENLRFLIVRCVSLGQKNPFIKPEIIADDIIKEWKKQVIRRIK